MDQSFQYKGKTISPYFSKEQLEIQVQRVADEIHRDLHGEKPIFIGVLNGAFIFMADLVRKVNRNMEVELDFIKLSSYEGQQSTGIVKALSGIKADVKGRHVVIVEDIVETGLTITAVIEELKKLEPASVRLASCFLKKGKQKVDIKIDYLALEVDDYFIIGYGLDWDEYGRGLDGLWKVEVS